ncbi:MAG: hypothetical protein RMX65_017755 [Nostoc sp. DedQUE01]|nr:hypothetical protein [Nostoc sp. DedQUE11]MDZ8075505.1 hypothetical protein [Nostoc sp. DedQUE01]MDZ8079740.1 hypothetical protein [Nostoc sp. DcaGUA01]
METRGRGDAGTLGTRGVISTRLCVTPSLRPPLSPRPRVTPSPRPLLYALDLVADMLMAGNELTIHGIRIWDHGQI